MEHILLENFSQEKCENFHKKFTSNEPFPHLVIDNFLNEESANKILENFSINKNWTNCSLVNNYKKYMLTNKNHMNAYCHKLLEELESEEFVKILSKITGMKNIFLDVNLEGGGLHQTFNGGSLNIHTDYYSHTVEKSWRRVINIIIFFNKDWLDKYNGELEFWDANVKNKIQSVPPIFNRCVIFKTDKKSFHGHPKKLNLPPNISRKSIAAYYFAEEKENLKLYPTKYFPRPNDTVFYIFLIHLDTFLKKIYSFLKRWGVLNDRFISKILDLINFFKNK